MNPFAIFGIIASGLGIGVAVSKYEKSKQTPAKVVNSLPSVANAVPAAAPAGTLKSTAPAQATTPAAVTASSGAPQSLSAKAAALGWNSMDAKSP
jgi:hypothetical protein